MGTPQNSTGMAFDEVFGPEGGWMLWIGSLEKGLSWSDKGFREQLKSRKKMCMWSICVNDIFIISVDPVGKMVLVISPSSPRSHCGPPVVFYSALPLGKNTKGKPCRQTHQLLEEAVDSPEVIPFLLLMPIKPASPQQATSVLWRSIFWLVNLYTLWVNGKALVVLGGVVDPALPQSFFWSFTIDA